MADSLYQKYILMHKNVPVAEIELDHASAHFLPAEAP